VSRCARCDAFDGVEMVDYCVRRGESGGAAVFRCCVHCGIRPDGHSGGAVPIFDGQGLAPARHETKKRCFTTHTNAQAPPPPRLPLVVFFHRIIFCGSLGIQHNNSPAIFLPNLSLLTPTMHVVACPLASICVVRCVCEWNPAMCWGCCFDF